MVLDLRMKEMTISSGTCYIILDGITDLLVVEFAVLAFPATTDPIAKLPKFAACFGVGILAGFSCYAMFTVVTPGEESAEVRGFPSLRGGIVSFLGRSIIIRSSDFSINKSSIVDRCS